MSKYDGMKKDMKKEAGYSGSLVKTGWKISALLLVTIVILIASIQNAVGLQEDLGESTVTYVSDITREMARGIQDTIELKKAELVNVADSMGIEEAFGEEKDASEFMRRKAAILGFDLMVLIDRGGNYLMSTGLNSRLDGDLEHLTEMEAVEEAFKGSTSTSYTGDQNLCYVAPVWSSHGVKNVLVGIRSKTNMQSLLAAKSFNGKCLNCVVGGGGNLILAPTDMRPFEQLEDIFEVGSDEVKQDIVVMQQDMEEGEAGVFKFTSIDGKKNYLSYNSLNVNDWVLMTIVPANLISAVSDEYIIRSFLLVAGTLLTLAVFWMLLYGMYNFNRKKLIEVAYSDPLTGGMNNKAFQLKYEELEKKQDMQGYAIVMMDVRNFKLVNESFGTAVGNQMLRYIY